MPYQTESEEKLLLSEELTLSLKRFELVGYSYYFTLFLSFIALFTSKLTIHSSTGIVLHIAIIVYHTHFIEFFMVELLCNYVKLMLINMLSQLLYACTSWRYPRNSASCRNGLFLPSKGSCDCHDIWSSFSNCKTKFLDYHSK